MMKPGSGIPLKWFCILGLLALVLLLVPMLNAARYDVPSEDDYPYGLETMRAWNRDGTFMAVLEASWNRILRTYRTWQGSFSAVFLFTMNPMIYGEEYYSICPWLVLGMLLIGVFTLTQAVWHKAYGGSRTEALIIGTVLSVICTQFLPRASQGIYWFNGAVYYTFFFGLAAVAYAVLLRYLLRDPDSFGIGKLAAAFLLFFFIGGGNLVTGLMTAVLLVSIEVHLILSQNRDRKTFVIPMAGFFIAFILNIAAPGNAVRQQFFGQPGLLESVFLSFKNAGLYFRTWFTLPVAALILMLLPILWRIAFRTERRFRLPGLVTLYAVCLTGVMFYPPIFAMTDHALSQAGRITNIIFFGMVFLVVFLLYYWMGWLIQRGWLSARRFPSAARRRYNGIYLCVILLLFGTGMTQIKWYDTTSISAFRSYRSGQMGNYYHTYKQRLEILKDPEIRDAVLKRFPTRPYVLFYREMSEDPEGNTVVANWYGKDSVVVK